MAGDGTLATIEGATAGAKVGGKVEGIILVGGIGCRVEKAWRTGGVS
jgi:hypothetical protein